MKSRALRIIAFVVVWTLLLPTLVACAHKHDFGSWKTDKKATCTETGKRVRKCDCGEKETEKIEKLEHNYKSKVTEVAGCSGDGLRTYTCKDCDDSYTETITAKTYSSTEIHDMYVDSVGEIIIYDKKGNELALGSCFVYETENKLLTNYHVIEGAYSAKVTFGEETYTVEKVLAYDKNIDIAVLEVANTGLTPANMCEEDHAVGEVVYAIGNSRGLTSTFSDGMITYSCREVGGVNYVQHDAPISSGNSGGPLINEYGEVIGINTWTVNDSQNLNFAIHVTELENLENTTAMTMSEFYDTECNPYKTLKDYAIENGSGEDDLSMLTLQETSYEGYDYIVQLAYFADSDDLWITFSIDFENYVYFILDEELSGTYTWGYFDDYDTSMQGTLKAGSFTGESILSCTYSNVTGEDSQIALELATTMMDVLCWSLDDALADFGITAVDLGFVYY